MRPEIFFGALILIPLIIYGLYFWFNREMIMTRIRNERIMRDYDLSKLIEKLPPDEREKMRRK